MTLPNWAIRCIVFVLAVPATLLQASYAAWECIRDDAWPSIREAWREPEYTRWGSKRHER